MFKLLIYSVLFAVYSLNTFGQSIDSISLKYKQEYLKVKPKFKVKQLNDSTYSVQVKDLMSMERDEFGTLFLEDPIGKPDGILLVSEKNGKQTAILHYKNEKEYGEQKFYFDDGLAISERNYENKTYSYKHYNKNNELISHDIRYFSGICIFHKEWYSASKVKAEYIPDQKLSIVYYESGKIKQKSYFNESETDVVKVEVYNEDGNIQKTEIKGP